MATGCRSEDHIFFLRRKRLSCCLETLSSFDLLKDLGIWFYFFKKDLGWWTRIRTAAGPQQQQWWTRNRRWCIGWRGFDTNRSVLRPSTTMTTRSRHRRHHLTTRCYTLRAICPSPSNRLSNTRSRHLPPPLPDPPTRASPDLLLPITKVLLLSPYYYYCWIKVTFTNMLYADFYFPPLKWRS